MPLMRHKHRDQTVAKQAAAAVTGKQAAGVRGRGRMMAKENTSNETKHNNHQT